MSVRDSKIDYDWLDGCDLVGHVYKDGGSMCLRCGMANRSVWETTKPKITTPEKPTSSESAPLEDEIRRECNELADFLVDKNRKYGNSAVDPVRIFSKANVLEQLKVRIDDKLSRLRSAQLDEDEDVINDLIGYFILYRIAKSKESGTS